MHSSLLTLALLLFLLVLLFLFVVELLLPFSSFFLRYTWGEGKFGRLGHGGERNQICPRVVEALQGKKIVQVACGGFHSAAITDEGAMYSWGGGEHGQLGHGDKFNKTTPTFVALLGGPPHSRARGDDNEGLNEDGNSNESNTGNGSSSASSASSSSAVASQQQFLNKFITQITCGWSHTVALDSDGKVFSWGNGDHGKLGHGSSDKVSTPQCVSKLKNYKVVRVASYNEHTAALVEVDENDSQGLGCFASKGGMISLERRCGITQSYVSDMRSLVNDEEYSDIKFIVEGRPLFAHRGILARRSEHFKMMFGSGMRESFEKEIELPEMRYEVFIRFLEFVYTDSVKELRADAVCVGLFIAADLYQCGRLKVLCEAVIKHSLSSENVCKILQCSDDCCCEKLTAICMSFIVENFDAVSKTDGIR
jgi:RCC1 and BTB domain-containing protein